MQPWTVKEIEDLMEAVEAWEHGCPVLVAEKLGAQMDNDLLQKIADDPENLEKLGPSIFSVDITKKVDEVISARKEPGILLKAKLITLRNTVISDEANEILRQPD